MFGRRRNATEFNAEVAADLELEAERLKEQGSSDEDGPLDALRQCDSRSVASPRVESSLHMDFPFSLRPGNRGGASLADL
jgi:hypothetical protein